MIDRPRLLAAQANSQRQYADVVAKANRQLDQAEHTTARHMIDVKHCATSQVELGVERMHGFHETIVDRAAAGLAWYAQATEQQFAAIHERALGAIAAAEARAENELNTVLVASRRSIDGIGEHLHEYWRTVTANATGATGRLADLAQAHFDDVRHSASKLLEEAQSRSQDTFKLILALGVEPTLRRGFVMAKAQGKPVSSRAAALQHDQIELTFHDGALTVTPNKRENDV